MPCAMHVLYAITSDGPGHASASSSALTVCASFAPSATWATNTFPYDRAIAPRSFFWVALPAAANFATAPRGVDFDAWPPVFE